MIRGFAGLSFVLLVCPALWAQEITAPPKKSVAKPPVIKLRHDSGRIGYRLTIRPGVPEPGQTVSVELEISELLSIPDPAFGKRKPINDGKLTAFFISPAEHGKKRKGKKPHVTARTALRLPDAGTYGFTFTAKKAGVYGLQLRGTADSAGPVEYAAVIPFGVWPIPDGKGQDNPPPLPDNLPEASHGDRQHGHALCAQRCRTDIEAAWPKGKTPTFLRSDFGLALTDNALIKTMLKEGGPRLTPLERNDLLCYLRSLHTALKDFFPETVAYLAQEFTINEHGLKRLKESIKLEPSDAVATAVVFVAYAGDNKSEQPVLIDYDDRIARDRLDRKRKLGYLVFLELPKEPKAKELAIAMDREPIYSIRAMVARSASGKRDTSLNKKLKTFIGEGKFNDPRSLRHGSRSLQPKMVPVYLTAAELATMYYAAEREFTEFDAEFGDGEAPSAVGGELKVKVKK